jgi:Tol biopolymer transport system component
MNADGTGVRALTLDEGYLGYRTPTWSPDGTKIAVSRDRDGNVDIYVMNADGTGLRRLTDHPGVDERPTWSR